MRSLVHATVEFVAVDGRKLEVAYLAVPSARGTVLLLHEALGSVSYWRDFPARLALATGHNVLHYSRPGHGNSDGPLEERTVAHYLRQTQSVIPALLAHFGVTDPVLYGHSEGAGIAMLYAATTRNARALILESPYVVQEQSTLAHIRRMAAAYPGSRLQERLAQYHRHADTVFQSWAAWAVQFEVEEFFPRTLLEKIACPVLLLQGRNDEFGVAVHAAALRVALPRLEHELFENTGHLPHREVTDRLLSRVARFLNPSHPPAQPRDPLTLTTHLEE
jgi:pimeloyl-ACP methyl ester carboxylesterase